MALRNGALMGAAMLSLVAGHGAEAADLPARAAPPLFAAPVAFTWTGAYVGGFVGGGAGLSRFADPFGRSIYGDTVVTPFVEGGGQIGVNYQLPASRLVLGLEADGGAIGLTATGTCLAYSGFVVPANCHVGAGAMASGTGRVGYAFGADGRSLAYAKGGVAALFGETDITTSHSNLFGGPFQTNNRSDRVGYTIGVGLEQALSNAWSVKVEYDYADFGAIGLATSQTRSGVAPAVSAVGPAATSARQDLHELKVGLDYHIGAEPGTAFAAPDIPSLGPAFASAQGYSVEAGGRYWSSFGRFQKDLGVIGQPRNVLVSRLTYDDTSSTGELFGRIDTPSRVFVKGFVGAGGATSGYHNDEDFLIGNGAVPYSNTLSAGERGTIDYATVDLGYAFLRSGASSLGGFVGYNFYRDDQVALGCQQISPGGQDCVGAGARSTSIVGITENDTYNSLRVGVNADMWLGQIRLQADAAYLPLVGFDGVDTHLFHIVDGNHMTTEFGRGQGVQLELLASYYLTPSFSVGLGGRYWGMWLPQARESYFSTGQIQAIPTSVLRYGLLAQATYRFSTSTPEPVVARY